MVTRDSSNIEIQLQDYTDPVKEVEDDEEEGWEESVDPPFRKGEEENESR